MQSGTNLEIKSQTETHETPIPPIINFSYNKEFLELMNNPKSFSQAKYAMNFFMKQDFWHAFSDTLPATGINISFEIPGRAKIIKEEKEYTDDKLFHPLMQATTLSEEVKKDIQSYLKKQDFEEILNYKGFGPDPIERTLFRIKKFTLLKDKNTISTLSFEKYDSIVRMYHLALLSDQKEIVALIQQTILTKIKNALEPITHEFLCISAIQGAARLSEACDCFPQIKDFLMQKALTNFHTNFDFYSDTISNNCLRMSLEYLDECTLLSPAIARFVNRIIESDDFRPNDDTLPAIKKYIAVTMGQSLDNTFFHSKQDSKKEARDTCLKKTL